ncbi:MAG: Ig domain-containing protein [Steroidobacteraceae bacterium]
MSFIRSARVISVLGAVLVLAACSNASYRPITAQVGVDTGVALSTSGSQTSLLTDQTLGLGATVENASNTAGVSWSLRGVGSLTDITATTATYVAPTGTGNEIVTGSTTALITATSVANPTQNASVALIVLGTPIVPPTSLFPGNVNVAYQAPIAAAGGDAPFTWVVESGGLPAGLALNGSTSSSTYIEGTPTAAGTFTFTLQTTDTLSRVASQTFTMTVKPQTACVLSGRFTFLFTGFRGGAAATHVGAISIDPTTGDITGEQDYKDPHRTTSAETLNSGNCINRETNTGTLTLNAPSGQLVYNFSATPPDASGVIHSAGLQLIHSGEDSGSGQMLLQDLSGVSATPPTGNFAFGLFGVDASENHFGMAGRFTSSTAGVLGAGLVDSNDTTPLTGAALTGAVTAADANGRGTLTLQAGSQTTTLGYYLVGAGKMLMIDIDPTPNANTRTIRMGGQMTAQTGNATATTFDAGALATPSILSLFGRQGDVEPVSVMGLGRLSGANTTSGTVNALLDTSDQDTDVGAEAFNGSYAVAASGRGTLTLANSTATRSFGLYLDGISNGYIVEHGSTSGNTGLLEAQFQGPYTDPPATGIFPSTMPNAYISYTAYPQAAGPITLNSLLYLNYDALASNFVNGSFAIDPTSGRGLGTITQSGVGTTAAVLYIVSESKMDLMRFGNRAIDGSIEAIIQ